LPAVLIGHHGQIDHPDVGVAFSPEQANRMIETGYRVIFLGFDWSLLQTGIAAAVSGIQR